MKQPDLFTVVPEPMRFDGETFEPARDAVRLSRQYVRVFELMKDGQWRSLEEIERRTGDPQASISARLRDMRKERFGGHTIGRRHAHNGLFEYQLVMPRDE